MACPEHARPVFRCDNVARSAFRRTREPKTSNSTASYSIASKENATAGVIFPTLELPNATLIPEPAGLALLALAGVGMRRRRGRTQILAVDPDGFSDFEQSPAPEIRTKYHFHRFQKRYIDYDTFKARQERRAPLPAFSVPLANHPVTLADRPTSASRDASAAQAAAPVKRPWWRRMIDACIPGRRAAICRYEEMVELARQNPPPQRWYDEDLSRLRKPRSS